jgi:hypothetical protein
MKSRITRATQAATQSTCTPRPHGNSQSSEAQATPHAHALSPSLSLSLSLSLSISPRAPNFLEVTFGVVTHEGEPSCRGIDRCDFVIALRPLTPNEPQHDATQFRCTPASPRISAVNISPPARQGDTSRGNEQVAPDEGDIKEPRRARRDRRLAPHARSTSITLAGSVALTVDIIGGPRSNRTPQVGCKHHHPQPGTRPSAISNTDEWRQAPLFLTASTQRTHVSTGVVTAQGTAVDTREGARGCHRSHKQGNNRMPQPKPGSDV